MFLKYVGQTSANPLQLEISEAKGIYLYTPEGKQYIDLVSGVSVSSLGHAHPAIIEAVKLQSEKYLHLMVYGEFVQSPQTQYAEWLINKLPAHLNNVFYVNSGSEAIEGAMKLSKRYTGRPEIVAFCKAYHGGTQGALSIIGDKKFQSGFLPLLPGIRHLEFNAKENLDLINRRTAAVIVEPIQAEAGIIEPKDDFLKSLRRKCNETGTLLVFDEIQTGFGRTGRNFAFEHYDVSPDIICFAKSFGGGLPLGAFVSSSEIMKTLTFDPPLGHITTFGGHPLSCAAGLAAQKYIEEHKLIDHVNAMEILYRDLLRHEAIVKIRGKGLFLAVEFNEMIDGPTLMKNIFNNQIIVDQFLFCNNAFRIAPPLNIKKEEVILSAELLLKAIRKSKR
jgi:acetylornithine/succinyldiaminopimelate/putrescine aminotransferase